MSVDLTRGELARIALAAWVNVAPDKLPVEKMWIEHPSDANRQAWERVAAAIAEHFRPSVERIAREADRVVQRVTEYDDRTSPEDWPEALLVTGEELKAELLQFADALGAPR